MKGYHSLADLYIGTAAIERNDVMFLHVRICSMESNQKEHHYLATEGRYNMTGVYMILAELGEAKEIQVGKRQRFAFEKGFYGYVGSALVGLERRVVRHLGTRKKFHWHIDYLLNSATVQTVICAETSQGKECLIAQALSQRLPTILGFGCSDCDCPSHLFFCQDLEALKGRALDAFKHVNLSPFVIA